MIAKSNGPFSPASASPEIFSRIRSYFNGLSGA
jgi:hypothetical protein